MRKVLVRELCPKCEGRHNIINPLCGEFLNWIAAEKVRIGRDASPEERHNWWRSHGYADKPYPTEVACDHCEGAGFVEVWLPAREVLERTELQRLWEAQRKLETIVNADRMLERMQRCEDRLAESQQAGAKQAATIMDVKQRLANQECHARKLADDLTRLEATNREGLVRRKPAGRSKQDVKH